MTSFIPIFSSIDADLCILIKNVRDKIGKSSPNLLTICDYPFETTGKLIRPAIILLISRATMSDQSLSSDHRQLAEIVEMIHVASLVHDDLLDEAEIRRGMSTTHHKFGSRVAIWTGVYLFGYSSCNLAAMGNLEVVKLLSKVIVDLVEGEIQQGLNHFNVDLSIENYLTKSYCKTASLIANSSQAAGLLSGVPRDIAVELYNYGRHLGLAFQIVDDILDFTSSAESLGKPSGTDLKSGNLTAPVLFAIQENPSLKEQIASLPVHKINLEQVISLIIEGNGIQQSRELARHHTLRAIEHLKRLPPSEYRQILTSLANYVLSRLY